MLTKVSLIPPNKDYIVLTHRDGKTSKFPRQYGKHVRVNDICTLGEYRGRPCLKLLTDDDEQVIVTRKPEPKPPEPIPTP